MKLWKSPVFYFGIVLVLAVAAALSAPYVVDWGQYRSAIEDYGRKLTGREVRAEGVIAVRLFPWPKLVIDGVKVANPPGARDAELLTAERIDVRVTLAGLFNGQIQVESIDVIRPTISLERMAAGRWTWRIAPTGRLARSGLLDHVKLDKVAIRDGTLRLIDGRRGGSAEIAHVNAAFSAPGIGGPWRVRGTGDYRGRPLEIALTTGSWRADEPFRLALRVSPGDGSGLVYDFDGENDGTAISGALRIAQAAAEDGKSDAEGAFRPLVLTAKVTATFDEIDLNSIAIVPRDDEKGGNLLSGDARVALGAMIGVDVNLTAAKFNLDAVAGAKAKSLLREGGALPLLAGLLAALPDGIDGKGTLKVNALIAGGEKLQNVLVSAAVTQDAIRIHELSAGLPGQTQALFDGIFIAGEGGPQLAGDISAESLDLRALVAWAWPEKKDAMLRLWSGNRGRLKFKTRIDAAPDRLRLTDTAYQIDDSSGAGNLVYASGARPFFDLKVYATLVDIDSFVPGGIAAVAPDGGNSFADAAALIPALAGPADARVSLKTGRLILNGVEAKDTLIDMAVSENGLELRGIEIGDVSGARLDVNGLVAQSAGQLTGSIVSQFKAKDPRGLLKLIGLAPGGRAPAWFGPLGETDLRIAANFKPAPDGKAGTFEISGKSGKLELAGTISLVDSLDWTAARIEGSGEIKSGLSSSILQLAGLAPVVASEAPGSIAVTMAGSLAAGVDSDVQASLFGARLQFHGKASGTGAEVKIAGRAAVSAERPQALFRSFGFWLEDALLFSAEGDVGYERGKLMLTDLQGVSAGAPFGGELVLAPGGRLTGSLDVSRLRLSQLLAQLYLPWNGERPDAEAPFARALPLGLQGEIWIKPQTLTVFDGFDVPGTQIGLTAEGRDIRLAVFGKTGDGDSVALELNGQAVPGGRTFDGKLTFPVDLAGRLKMADGKPVGAGVLTIDGGFSGFGRSPASVLAGLSGSGSYRLRGVSLGQFEPDGFASRIAKAKSQEDVDAALAALLSGKALDVADTIGSITLEDGVASFLPLRLNTPAADAVIRPMAELGTGRIDIGIGVQLKAPAGIPGLEVAYAGAPMALSRSIDAAALQARLGMDVLQRGVDELERLQKEQRRVAALEEKARAEDAARLDAYEAKRRELRQRQREVRVHRRLHEIEAKRAKDDAAKALKEASREPEPSVEEPPPAPRPKAKARPSRPAAKKPEVPLGPLVIVPPAQPPPPPQKQPPKTLFELLNRL